MKLCVRVFLIKFFHCCFFLAYQKKPACLNKIRAIVSVKTKNRRTDGDGGGGETLIEFGKGLELLILIICWICVESMLNLDVYHYLQFILTVGTLRHCLRIIKSICIKPLKNFFRVLYTVGPIKLYKKTTFKLCPSTILSINHMN